MDEPALGALLRRISSEQPLTRRGFLGFAGAGLLVACGTSNGTPQTAASGPPLQVGVPEPLTGALVGSYKPLYVPLQVAVDDINGAGGILGRQVKLDVQDDGGQPANEGSVVRTLLDNGDGFIVGPVGSSQAQISLQASQQHKVVQFPFADNDTLGDPTKYPGSYRLSRTTSDRVALTVDYVVDTLKAKKVALLYENTAIGQIGGPSSVDRLKSKGVTPVAVEVFDQLSVAVASNVTRLRNAGAEAVLVWAAVADDNVRIMTAMAQQAYFPDLTVTWDGVAEYVPVSAALAGFRDKIHWPVFKNFSWTAGKPLAQKQLAYARKVVAATSVPTYKAPGLLAPFYDAMFLIKAAAEATRSFDFAKVNRELENLKNYAGLLGNITFTPQSHSGLHADSLVMARIPDLSAPESLGFLPQRQA